MGDSIKKYVCFNCKDDSSHFLKNGWKDSDGHFVQLCFNCSSIYKAGQFCEMFHSDEDGWRDCESCNQLIHCGCIVSVSDYILHDSGRITCNGCSTATCLDLELMETEKHEPLQQISFEHEPRKNQLEELKILEQKKTNERMLKLAEEQMREKEKLHNRIIEFQKKLDEKQRLELEIEQMKGAVKVMKHMTDEDPEANKRMDLIKDLKDKEEELEAMEALIKTLIVKERSFDDELVDVRQELIAGLMENSARALIGVKIMGFITAAKRNGWGKQKARKLASLWEEHFRDLSWHPFKVITVDGNSQEIINEEDEKIRSLKTEFDKDVYNALVTALNERIEYNPIGRYPIPELWNNKENRKATLKEVFNAFSSNGKHKLKKR